MEQELLLKVFEVNELIKNEIKIQKTNDKDKLQKDKNMKISLNAKNALRILSQQDNINQRTLAKKLNITSQAMSEIIKKLEQANYIQKRNNKINNENIISITDEGIEKANMFTQRLDSVCDKVFKDMTTSDKDKLLELLEKMSRVGDIDEHA